MRLTPKGITQSETFANLVEASFNEVDYDKNERLDYKELYIALLLLYDKMNSLLPVHVPVPTKFELDDLLKRYDVDSSGTLDFAEFLELSKNLFGGHKGWRDSILLRASVLMVMSLIVWPLAGASVQRGFATVGFGFATVIPTPVWAIAVQSSAKLMRSSMRK